MERPEAEDPTHQMSARLFQEPSPRHRIRAVALIVAIWVGAGAGALPAASASSQTADLVFDSVDVGGEPADVALSPDGRKAYVANSADSTVSVVELPSLRVIATVPTVSVPSSIAVSPDGSSIWVASGETWDWTVPVGYTVIDARSLATRTIEFIASTSMTFTPDGRKVWAGLTGSAGVEIIDVATLDHHRLTPAPEDYAINGIVFDSARGLAYVSAGSNGMASVSVYNTATEQSVRHPVTGIGTSPIALTPDGTRLFSMTSSRQVTVTETSFSSKPHYFGVERQPSGLAITRNGDSVFFVSNDYYAGQNGENAHAVFSLDVDSGQLLWTAVAPTMVTSPALSADGSMAFMTAPQTGQLLRVALPTAPSIDATVDRVAGSDRYHTAINISASAFDPGSVTSVYLATGTNFPDALSAAPAAAHTHSPVLLTPPERLPADVLAEIRRLGAKHVKIVGGEASVSTAVSDALRDAGLSVQRLAGVDRYDTSRKIVSDAFVGPIATIYFATGMNFPDALSGAAAAGARGVPVVLVPGAALPAGTSTLDQPTIDLISALKPQRVLVLGGTASVSEQVGWAIHDGASPFSTAGEPMRRIWGVDRFQTSALVSADAFTTSPRAFVATGFDFPDALAGAAVAGGAGAPLFVVPGSCVPASTTRQIARLGVERITLLGGTASLTTGVESLTRC